MSSRLALLVVALALPVAAQPSPDALVDAWVLAQRAADHEVALTETLERTVDGPRRALRVETEGTVRYAPGAPPRRTLSRGSLNGEALTDGQLAALGRRLESAFGPGGRELGAPPPPAHRILSRADARSVTEDAVDGEPAWRVALRLDPPPPPREGRRGRRGRRPPPPRPDALTAWFSRDGARLLGLRVEGRRRGGRVTRELRFQRHAGLDVPRSASARAELRQRRRLRSYAVEITSSARYRIAD